MTSINDELIEFIADPSQLATACAVASWIEADKPNPTAPAAAIHLLADGTNLATALTVRDAVTVIQKRAVERFWRSVETNLQELLRNTSCKGWIVHLDIAEAYVSIYPAAEAQMNTLFQVCAEDFAAPAGRRGAYFGVWKSEEARDEDKELEDALKRENFKPHKVWTGYKYFSSCGLPDFTMTYENLVRVNADNHNADRPLANEITQTLWQLFDAHRPQLEVLNRRVAKIRF